MGILYYLWHPFKKVAQQLLFPYNLAALSLVLALWFLHRGRPRATRIALWSGFLMLIVPSMPIVAVLLLAPLENAYPSLPVASYPSAGAIVVLGGTTRPLVQPSYEPFEVGSRLLHAVRLYRAGKAPWILVTGGVAYEDEQGVIRTEADDMQQILVDMGIPPDRILMENQSLDTAGNARLSAEILKSRQIDDILLVTSAFHMRRSKALFDHLGIEVIPSPTGHESLMPGLNLYAVLPSPGSMQQSTQAIKEYVGYLVYGIFGKL